MPLAVAPPPPVLGWTRDALQVDLPGLGPVDIGLRGRHQAANAAVADALLDDLEAAGIATVPAEARRRGYAAARVAGPAGAPGDAPPADGPREVLLDGAHNPDGAAALALALDDLRPMLAGGREPPLPPLTLVWASMADKDVRAVVEPRSRRLDRWPGRPSMCTALDLPRALPAADLAGIWREHLPGGTVLVARDPDAAFEAALAAGRGPVVVAGSLYLVGAARARLVDDPALQDPGEA